MTTIQLLPLLLAPVAGTVAAILAAGFACGWTTGQPRRPSVSEVGAASAEAVDFLPEDGGLRYGGSSLSLAALSLIAIGLAGWAALAHPAAGVWTSCLFGWWLLALAAIDIRMFILPDLLTAPLAVAGLLVTWLVAPDTLLDHATGAVAGFATLALIRSAYRLLRGREGLGLGDAKLLGAIGAWLGWQALPSVVLIAALASLALVLVVAARGRRTAGQMAAVEQPVPFGPFLATGAWVVWLHGNVVFSLVNLHG